MGRWLHDSAVAASSAAAAQASSAAAGSSAFGGGSTDTEGGEEPFSWACGTINGYAREGWAILSAVPSCTLMFKQELPLMFPGDEAVARVLQHQGLHAQFHIFGAVGLKVGVDSGAGGAR